MLVGADSFDLQKKAQGTDNLAAFADDLSHIVIGDMQGQNQVAVRIGRLFDFDRFGLINNLGNDPGDKILQN